MKFLRFFAAAASALFLFMGCNLFELPSPYPDPDEAEAPEKFVPYETIYVSVPDSSKTVIYLGSTRVATCYKSGYVVVPKATQTRALSDYQIVNVHVDQLTDIASENTLEMVVAFEDTKVGDHDYNDLVFQSLVKIENGTKGTSSVSLEITPVAMGSSIVLGLGYVLTGADGSVIADKAITDDCRTFLFGGDSGFINTVNDRKHYDPVTVSAEVATTSPITGIAWYLIAKEEKLYASNSFQACVDDNKHPQGLVIMKLRPDEFYQEIGGTEYYCGNDFWQYPKECTYIGNVYPDYEEYFIGDGSFSALANPTGNFYNAIAAEDDGALTDDCLYTAYHQGGESGGTSGLAIPEAIQLWANGPKWATFNIGATKPEEYGQYFEWATVEGYECPGETSAHKFSKSYTENPIGRELTTSFDPGDVRYDAARYNFGGKWRVPTQQEVYDLTDAKKTTKEVIENYNGSGITVLKVSSKNDDSKFIILPFSGQINQSTAKDRNSLGLSWTATIYPNSPASGYSMRVTTAGVNLASANRNAGLTIRAVCD